VINAKPERKRKQSGTALILGTASLVLIVPIIGLAIDTGFLYAVKAQLQAAVDGSALAAARALNLGQDTNSQKSSAKQNAVNWFFANFPQNVWATTNTVMTTADSNVDVYDDCSPTPPKTAPSPCNPNLRHVDVTASTRVPTWFMRWLGFSTTNISALGYATRRDVVAMLVLDRSGSMCNGGSQPCNKSNTTLPCSKMITAAKLFTGQFAAGRDYIGMATFNKGTFLTANPGGASLPSPSQSFRTTLGYTDTSGNSGTGAIDNISCEGGTGTAEAISMAYNELYRTNLPGAFNIILLETDGLPNSVANNWYDGSTFGIAASSNCTDANSRKKSSSPTAGWRNNTPGDARAWTAAKSFGTGSYLSNVSAGAIGVVYVNDPAAGAGYNVMGGPWQTANNTADVTVTSAATGCLFAGGSSSSIADFAWMPRNDIFGNDMYPGTNPYKAVSVDGSGHVRIDLGSTTNNYNNLKAAAYNSVDNAAYRARSNGTFPVYVFAIGLGGNGDPPDTTLLARVANDPSGDRFNNPPLYSACALVTGCVTYSGQPQGAFVYSSDTSTLQSAFLAISSQILRLSR
jgi:Flp pilus assembly protein TadG